MTEQAAQYQVQMTESEVFEDLMEVTLASGKARLVGTVLFSEVRRRGPEAIAESMGCKPDELLADLQAGDNLKADVVIRTLKAIGYRLCCTAEAGCSGEEG